MQCPQCGFLEFDEHSGCAVCGFRSQAARETMSSPPQDHEDNLIEFPHRPGSLEKPPNARVPAPPKSALPLFDDLKDGAKTEADAGSTIWREELQQKLREYRARREETKRNPLLDEDISELSQKFPSSVQKKDAPEESKSALDEMFKVHPPQGKAEPVLDLPVHQAPAPQADLEHPEQSDMHHRFPNVATPEANSAETLPPLQATSPAPARESFPKERYAPPPAKPEEPGEPASPPPANSAKSFELPSSVQRIKQQRQAPRRSDLFQHSLLFEPDELDRREMGAQGFSTGLPRMVASSQDRFLAGLYDLLVLFCIEALCLLPPFALARALHWQVRPGPRSLAILFSIAVFLALAYLLFFTALMKRTPGMRRRGLVLINFAGGVPSVREALLRTAGYLVSTGSLMLGFVWILFDVDALAWHDRISKTYPVLEQDLKPIP